MKKLFTLIAFIFSLTMLGSHLSGGDVADGVYFYVLELWKGNVDTYYYGTLTIIEND